MSSYPIWIGEQCNFMGSRSFRSLVERGDTTSILNMANQQIAQGAQLIDFCLAGPGQSELQRWQELLPFLEGHPELPLMVDVRDWQVFELLLNRLQRPLWINSLNLGAGAQRLRQMIRTIQPWQVPVVVGLLDQGWRPATSFEAKMQLAQRLFSLLVEECQLRPELICWDPLLLPFKTHGSAASTLMALGALKRAYPQTRTLIGLSNISFGLPASERACVHRVMLDLAAEQQLDFAIVPCAALKKEESRPRSESDTFWRGQIGGVLATSLEKGAR